MASHTGCIPTAAGTEAIIVMVVMEATVPDPECNPENGGNDKGNQKRNYR